MRKNHRSPAPSSASPGPLPGAPADPYQLKHFHGRVSRDDSEERMHRHGLTDGLYLLRESLYVTGNYALSLSSNNIIYHYVIEKGEDGLVGIEDGPRFRGPVELLQHYTRRADGLLTNLRIPCERLSGEEARTYRNMNRTQLENILSEAMTNLGMSERTMNLVQKNHLRKMVMAQLHRNQKWFHGKISREEAQKRLNASGLGNGKFLVREKDHDTYAIAVCYDGNIVHYKVEKNTSGAYSIQDGHRFDSIIQLVDHYSQKKDGLYSTLQRECVDSTKRQPSIGEIIEQQISPSELKRLKDSLGNTSRPTVLPKPFSSGQKQRGPKDEPLPPIPTAGAVNLLPAMTSQRGDQEEPDDAPQPVPLVQKKKKGKDEIYGVAQLEKIYDRVAKKKRTATLDYRRLDLGPHLGKGAFGSVLKGEYITEEGTKIPVAVKTLKQESNIPNSTDEILKEAELMASLDHAHIVRMIGMCKSGSSGPMMLVLELAELGPLNKYMKKHQELTGRTILELLLQVAKGMKYLESSKFVHRDLAARNVLLVSETFAKISDFGMSKCLGLGNNYYVAEQAGKWPLKWYAPECIYHFKFSSKSDVWSYGITLWEALSYGRKPYDRKKGQEIIQLLEMGERLEKPLACPSQVYEMMLQFWEYDAHNRPNFSEVEKMMESFLKEVRSGKIKLDY